MRNNGPDNSSVLLSSFQVSFSIEKIQSRVNLMLHEKAKVLLLSTIFHILKLFSFGPCQKQGAEQDWLLISLPDIWGCEDFAVLNCISRSRGEKEKVSKEEIETERIKRVNGREGLLKGLIDS